MRTFTESQDLVTAAIDAETADHLHDVACRIHQTALELLTTASVTQRLVASADVPESVLAVLESGAAAAALIAQLSCELQLELDSLGPDAPVRSRRYPRSA